MAITVPSPQTVQPERRRISRRGRPRFDAPLSVEEVPARELEPGQIRVKVEASGLCHTDIHAAHGDWPVKPSPAVHPGSRGRRDGRRAGSRRHRGRDRRPRGDAVARLRVRHLRLLRLGLGDAVPEQKNMGYGIDGGFGEFAIAYARYVVKVPDGIDPFDAAPLTCAGVTTYKAVKVAGTRSSDLVAVFGVGGLGHLAIQYAAIAGGRVIAVDLIDEKLELARELGAEFTINAARRGSGRRRSRRSAAPTRRSRSRCRRGRSSRPTGRCVAAARSCSSRCRPTTTSRSRSSKPCSTGSRSWDRSSARAPTCARCSSCTPPARPKSSARSARSTRVNESIADVEAGRVAARIVFAP